MPTSGAVFNQNPNFSTTSGRVQTSSSPNFFQRLGWKRLLVFGAELAAGFIAAPFTGGASTAVAIGTDIGIATAGAIANQVIDYSEGSVSLSSTLINVASPLAAGTLSGAFRGLGNLRRGSKILNDPFSKNLNIIKTVRTAATDEATPVTVNGFNTTISRVGDYTRGQLGALTRNVSNNITKAGQVTFTQSTIGGLGSRAGRLLANVGRGGLTQTSGIGRNIKSTLEDAGLDAVKIAAILERIGSNLSDFETSDAVLRLLRQELTSDELATFIRITSSEAGEVAAEAEEEAVKESYKLFSNTKQDMKALRKQFREFKGAEKGARWKTFKQFAGSAEFNDIVVQKTQLITDARDAGRFLVEESYKPLKRAITRFFSKFRMVGKYIDNFLKLQGAVALESSWIGGYRIISNEGAFNFVQIAFIPEATNSKPPVHVWLTKSQIESFVADPGRYYKRKIERKGFMLRGSQNSIAGHVFSLVPSGLMRNLLSFSSNVSQFIFDVKNGDFSRKWGGRAFNSFNSTWKNRLGRLAGRGIIGGAASTFLGRRIGGIIGKEAQRASSKILIPKIEGKKVDVQGAIITSLGSNLKSAARRSKTFKGSAILGTNSLKRQFGFVGRIPSSVSGGRLSLGKIKLKK